MVKRYELFNLPALNFVIDDVLEGGVNSSLVTDAHGKTLSFYLLGQLKVKVPKLCVPENSIYLEKSVNIK